MDDHLTHLDDAGRPRMVDVSAKPETRRRAVAACVLRFTGDTRDRVLKGTLPKGSVLDVARLAGVGGAKRTAELIPLCHPLRISDVNVSFEPRDRDQLEITAEVVAVDRTGVEMEALCAASTAALTVYDMVKAVDRGMVIQDLRLLAKEGGRSGPWKAGDGA